MRVSVLTSIVAILATTTALPILQEETEVSVSVNEQVDGWLSTVKDSVTTLLGLEETEQPSEIKDPDTYWKHYGKQQRKYWKHYGKEQKKKWTPRTPEDGEPESDVELMDAEIEDPDYWKHYGKQQRKYWKHYGKEQKKKWTPKTPEDGDDDGVESFEESELAEDPAKKWKHYGKQWKHYGKQWKKKAPTGEAPDMPELPSDDEFESFEVVVEDPAKKWKKIGKHWKHYGKDQKKKWAPKTPEDGEPESDVESMDAEIEDPDYWKHYGKQQRKYWKHYGKEQKKKWTPKTPEDGDDDGAELFEESQLVEDPAKKWKKIGKHWKHFGKDQKKKWAPKTPEDDAPEDPSDVELMDAEIEDPDYWKHYGKDQKKYWKHYGKDQKKKWTPKTSEDGDDESFQLVNQA